MQITTSLHRIIHNSLTANLPAHYLCYNPDSALPGNQHLPPRSGYTQPDYSQQWKNTGMYAGNMAMKLCISISEDCRAGWRVPVYSLR